MAGDYDESNDPWLVEMIRLSQIEDAAREYVENSYEPEAKHDKRACLRSSGG
jgi:hypothetical protein